MLFMLIRRVFLGGVTVCIVSLIIFAGVEMLPGDACTQFLGEYQADEELLAQCRKDLDLNRPPIDRFAEWTQGAITGDLGLAADGTTKISTIVGDRLKNSLLLAFCAMAVGIPLALLLGVISGLWRDRIPDIIASTLAIFAMTIPEFVSATLLILVFSVWLGWLPGIVLTSAAAPASEFFPEISAAGDRFILCDVRSYHAHGALIGYRCDGQRLCSDGNFERRSLLADGVSACAS